MRSGRVVASVGSWTLWHVWNRDGLDMRSAPPPIKGARGGQRTG